MSNTIQQFHYYASTALNWAVAPTRAEAIRKVAHDCGSELIKRQVKANGGLYCWSCRVGVPQDTNYDISFYRPQGVEVSNAIESDIINVKGHCVLRD